MMSSDEETSTPGRDGDFQMNSSIRRHTSVSFGRFENEHLSWDKYSSFSQNKYLEEAERFSTPGSVVKRKAFFEDFFRKKALEQKARLESLEDEDFADSSEPQMRASRDFQHSLCFDSSPEGSEHGDAKNSFKSKEGQQMLFMPDDTDEKEAADEIAKSVFDMMAQNNEPVSVSGAIFKPARDDNIEGFQFRNQEEEKRLSIEEMKRELQYFRNQKEEKSLCIEEMNCDLRHFRNQKEENSMSTEEMKRDLKHFGNQKEENSRSTEEMKRDLQYFGNKKEENSRSAEETKHDLQYSGNQKEENSRFTEEMNCDLQYFGNKKEKNSRSTEENKCDLQYFRNQREENRRSTEEMKCDSQQNGKTDESKKSIFKEEVKLHLPKPEISNGNIEGTSHLNIDEETPKKPSFTDFHQQNKMSKPKSPASSSSQVAEPINHKRIPQRRSVSNSKVRPSKPSVSSERSKANGGEVKRSKPSVNQSSIKDVLGDNTKLSCSLNLNKPFTAAAGESAASTKRESVERRRPSKTVTNRPIMNATSKMPTSINQASKAAEVDASSKKQHLTSQKEKMDERPAGGRRGDMHVPSSPRIRRHSNAVKSNNGTSLTEEMHVVSSPRVRRHSSAVKSNMTDSTGFGFRSNERAERRKEFDMKREEKMNMKEAEKSKIQEKTQEEKEAEIKQLRKALNFKATPMPHFYNEATLTKSEVRKAVQSYGKSTKTGRKSGEVGSGSDSAVEIVDASASPPESNDNGPIEKHKCISVKHNRATTSGANTPYKRVPREKPFTVPIVKSIKENPSKLDSRTPVYIQKSPKETHGLPFKENPSKLDSRSPARFQKSAKETLGLARTPKDETQKGKPPTDAARRIPKCFEKDTQIQSEGILDVTSAVGSCDTESCGTADGDEEVCFIGKNKGRNTLHKTDGFNAKDNSNQHHNPNAKRAHHYGSSNVHSNNESKSKISKASKKDGHVSDESGKQEAGKNTPSKRNVKTGMSCLVSDIAVA